MTTEINGHTIEPQANLYSANLRSANLYSANLHLANLRSADLHSADLRSANLHSANLHSADLEGASFSDANLSCSTGVVWAQIGPIGTDARTLTAVWHGPDEGTIFHAGCFRGTPSKFREAVNDGGQSWGWPEEHDHLAAECLAAADWCETRVRYWLQAIEAEASA